MSQTARTTAATLAIMLALFTGAAARSSAQPANHDCKSACLAAYAAIAQAIKSDSDNALARAIIHTHGFNYMLLSRALGVPNGNEILARFHALEQDKAHG